jgi:hypothetical protein
MLAHHNSNGIRTSVRSRIHSLPPSHRSPHLERHQLTQERARLQQEIARLELRRHQCRQRVADIEAQLALTGDEGGEGRPPRAPCGGTVPAFVVAQVSNLRTTTEPALSPPKGCNPPSRTTKFRYGGRRRPVPPKTGTAPCRWGQSTKGQSLRGTVPSRPEISSAEAQVAFIPRPQREAS